MDFYPCSRKQIQGLVKERNLYYLLLKESLHVLNELPNRKIRGLQAGSTYQLAAEIEKTMKRFDVID